MKKAIVVLTGLLLVSSLYAVAGVNLRLNLGAMTSDLKSTANMLYSAGAELDLRLMSFLMLSPEVNVYAYKDFKTFLLMPGVMLNLKLSLFFVGVGAVYSYDISKTGALTLLEKWKGKINAGLTFGNLKFTIYALTEGGSMGGMSSHFLKKDFTQFGAPLGIALF